MIATWIAIGLALSVSQAELDRCLGVEDDGARLACYDRLFERGDRAAPAGALPAAALPAAGAQAAATPPAAAARETPAVQAATPAAVPSAAPAPEAAFGLSVEKRPEGKVKSIGGRIVEVESSATGRHVIVLDNGQRWRQLEATTMPPFSDGETVEIRRAALGSYLATVPDSGRSAVRVRRED